MVKLKGYVKIIVFQNKENGYVIAKVRANETDFDWDKKELVTITGYFPVLHTSEYYLFEGELVEHAKYGMQMKVANASSLVADTPEGLIQYFSSDLFYGVGPKLAEKIVATFGETAIEQILENPAILAEVGVNDRKQKEIHRALETNQGLSDILTKLYGYGFGAKLAMQIYHKYYNQSLSLIEENPYRLIDDFDAVTFPRADQIAKQLQFDEYHQERLKALLFYVLSQLAQSGDTVYDFDTVFHLFGKQLSNQISVEHFSELLLNHELISFDETQIMIQSLDLAEQSIAGELNRFSARGDARVNVEDVLATVSETFHLTYSEEQKSAIMTAMHAPVSIITGGPGTGKTTVLQGLIEVYKAMFEMYDDRKIALCSPTGRAAKRMSESTGYKAKTIHSFLGYDYRGEFTYHKEYKIGPKLLIVDESSMIDTLLMKHLLEALKDDVRIVFLGDVDQLPSVGPGQVLSDLLASERIPTTRLTKIYRQDETSHLIPLAYGINQGEIDSDWFETDVRFLECEPSQISKTIQNVVQKAIQKGTGLESIQVLAPMYKGVAGIDQINYDLQSVLNPNSDGLEHYQRVFKIEDKVLQLSNQPEKNIMNGDIGTVLSIHDNKLTIDFEGNQVTYSKGELNQLKHAYCISIHKSQGNEYDTIIVPISMQYRIMLNKKLYYTAVTRAKKHVVFVGEKQALSYTVHAEQPPRKTRLKERILQYG